MPLVVDRIVPASLPDMRFRSAEYSIFAMSAIILEKLECLGDGDFEFLERRLDPDQEK